MVRQKDHICRTVICSCGNLIQSCTCVNRKNITISSKGCYGCMDENKTSETYEHLVERVYLLVLGDRDTPKTLKYYMNILESDGIKQYDVSSILMDLIHQEVLHMKENIISIGPRGRAWFAQRLTLIQALV